jgi:hypothetical protein
VERKTEEGKHEIRRRELQSYSEKGERVREEHLFGQFTAF